MEIIWRMAPVSAKDISIAAAEEIGWNKNTTYTILKKLVEKDAVKRTDPNFTCEPLITREQVRSEETRKLIDKLYDGSIKTFFSSFLKREKLDMSAVTGVPTFYTKLEDINPEVVPEIKFGLNSELFNPIIRETSSGFLYGYIPNLEVSYVSKDTRKTPRMRKLDKAGKTVWEKEYGYKVYSGAVNNLVVYPDESFVFSVQAFPNYRDGSPVYDKSYIVKCDREGNELWKRDFDDYSTGMLQNLFVTENGEIIALGHWRVKNGKQVKEEAADDIVATRLDREGNILKQKGFGGSDFDSINTVRFDRELGIIINGRTQSVDGDFAIDKDRRSASFIACIDQNLNLKWVSIADEKENIFYDQLAVSEGFIYVPGNYIKKGSADVSGFLIKFDKNGKRVWIKPQLYTGLWGRATAVLKSGYIILGYGQQNKGAIVVLDKDGNVKQRIEGLRYAPKDITPTEDGGYIITSIRGIKTVPQPLYISSIWYDTETVAIKYKHDNTIEWQKTFDEHKDVKGLDFVLPLQNGSIIVE